MGTYRTRVSQEIEQRLDEAELRGSCLAAADESLHRALATRKRAGDLVSPYPRLYVSSTRWRALNPAERARHMLHGIHELNPGWVFCGTSAAILLGLQVPFAALDHRAHVVLTEAWRGSSNRQVKRHPYYGDGLIKVQGITVTSYECTAFDCMRTLGFRYGTAVADSVLALTGMPSDQLRDYVASKRGGFRGAPQARMTAEFADARSANGGESVVRAIMHELGYAAPELQVKFPDPFEGGRSYYADYVWRPKRAQSSGSGEAPLVIGELDGTEKYFDPVMNRGEGIAGALLRERRRESRLTLTHAAIMRFTYAEALDVGRFDRLLETFGVPRDHKPLIRIPPLVLPIDDNRVPLEAYGV